MHASGECGAPPKWNRVAFAGMQVQQLGTLAASSPFFGATPTIQAGYEWVLAQTTTPDNETLTSLSDGTASYSGSAARQHWLNAIYNVLLRDWYETTEAGDTFTIYVNNLAPTQTLAIDPQQAWTNILFDGPILDDHSNDPEGDPLTWDADLGDTLPTGVTIQSVVLNSGEENERTVQRPRGTPATGQDGDYEIILRGTDIAGDTVTLTAFTLTVGIGVLVPTTDEGATHYLDALDELDLAGLGNVDIAPEINGATAGIVFDQDPEGGTYAIPGSAAILYVSGVAVPDVDDPGTSQATAQSAITAADLTPSIQTQYSQTIPIGEVIEQDPEAGTILAPEDIVSIVISLGPANSDALSDFRARRLARTTRHAL